MNNKIIFEPILLSILYTILFFILLNLINNLLYTSLIVIGIFLVFVFLFYIPKKNLKTIKKLDNRKYMKVITPKKSYDVFLTEEQREELIKKYPWMWIISMEK